MVVDKCVGCEGEVESRGRPRGGRELRAWEASTEKRPVVCQSCGGLHPRDFVVALVREDGELIALSTTLSAFGQRGREYTRLPAGVSRLYAKLHELGIWSLEERCQLLGHDSVTVHDPEYGPIAECRHCRLFAYQGQWCVRPSAQQRAEERAAQQVRAREAAEASKSPEQKEEEGILAVGGVIESSSEDDRGYYSPSDDDSIRHLTRVYRMPDGSARQLTFNVGRD